MIEATAMELQNNFVRYLDMVMQGHEVIVTQDGKEVGRFVPRTAAHPPLTDSLTGILRNAGTNDDLRQARDEHLPEKYAHPD